MAAKKTHEENELKDTYTQVRELLPRVDMGPLVERAHQLLTERPGLTIGAAVGTGFVLGLTLFSKVGRMALAGIIGLGAEIALQKARANLLEQNASA